MNWHDRRGAIFITLLFAASPWLQGLRSCEAQELWNVGSGFPSTTSYWGSSSAGSNWFGSPNNNQWRLGVEGTNTDVGVLVNRVDPGSAAARSGIASRDLIVCVGDQRVGRVGSRVFDLAQQLTGQAGARGQVQLLVQNSRTSRLTPINVQLDSLSQAGLTGALLLPGNARLPADSLVTLRLENVSRPHYVVRNGESTFRPPAYSSGAIEFTLNYDRNYVFPGDTYQLNAYVTSRGRTLYVASRPEYVLTQGNPTRLQMQLVPAASIATASVNTGNGGSVYTAGYTNYDLITQRVTRAYERYLERRPSTVELAAWHQIPDLDFRLSRLPLELMASQEYFDRVGDNGSVWLRKVFGEVIGRTPTALEFDRWTRRFAEVGYSRMEVLKQMQSVADSQ